EGMGRPGGTARPAQPPEPAHRVVEPLPDQPLQRLVPSRALPAVLVELRVPPDDPAREQHRPARPVALLQQAHLSTQLARTGGGDEPGHARPEDGDQRSAKPALGSTYSSFTRSGPQTNTARVFGASPTSATSTPSSLAGAASSTSTPRWLRIGRSDSPGSP